MKLAYRPAGPQVHYEPIQARPAVPGPGRFRYRYDPEKLHASIDVITVERLINGEPTPAVDAEKYAATLWLFRHAAATDDETLSVPEIARRVGVSARSIERWKLAGWPDRNYTADGAFKVDSHPGPLLTAADKWAARTQPTDDGHLLWTGVTTKSGVPTLNHDRRTFQAARIAYRMHTGRDPEGSARPNCGNSLCVRPDHVADLPLTKPLPPRRTRA